MKPSPWHNLNTNGPHPNAGNEHYRDVDKKFLTGQERWPLSDHWFAVSDRYPVSQGHTLLVPVRPVQRLSELSSEELADFWTALEQLRCYLLLRYAPDGVNYGINQGEAAGQTVSVLHVHVIPRYEGDMDDPRGGVRGVIPAHREYHTWTKGEDGVFSPPPTTRKTTKSGKVRKNPWATMTEEQKKARVRKMQAGRGIVPKFDRED